MDREVCELKWKHQMLIWRCHNYDPHLTNLINYQWISPWIIFTGCRIFHGNSSQLFCSGFQFCTKYTLICFFFLTWLSVSVGTLSLHLAAQPFWELQPLWAAVTLIASFKATSNFYSFNQVGLLEIWTLSQTKRSLSEHNFLAREESLSHVVSPL